MCEYKRESIKDFEEYQIDTNGVIYNKNGSIKKYSLNPRGYCIVNFIVNGKRIGLQVHRLVALQFIPNPNNLPQVNHIDGNKQNNSVKNLEWCSMEDNMRHSFDVLHRKPSHTRKIIGIDKNTGEVIFRFNSLADAGRYFAKDKNYRTFQGLIFRALNGKRKTYKGCYWEYVNNT